MGQLAFKLPPSLTYAPENFFRHAGVSAVFERLLQVLKQDCFRVAVVQGDKRSGKSHMAVALTRDLCELGFAPQIWDGDELAGRLLDGGSGLGSQDIIICDDADAYLSSLGPGDSGPLVNFIERLRLARSALVLFCAQSLDKFNCDQHVRSRLAPGGGFQIGAPSHDQAERILIQLALQRGLHLTEFKLKFLMRRLPLDIAGIEAYLERLMDKDDFSHKGARFPLLAEAVKV